MFRRVSPKKRLLGYLGLVGLISLAFLSPIQADGHGHGEAPAEDSLGQLQSALADLTGKVEAVAATAASAGAEAMFTANNIWMMVASFCEFSYFIYKFNSIHILVKIKRF